MSILSNAAISIRIGVDDYESGEPGRALSGIRNIYSGILLLAKEQLRRMSPPNSNDAFVKKQIRFRPIGGGAVSVQGVGKKTVDVSEIQTRFADLGLSFDWKPLQKIQDVRNTIEHYYFDGNPQEISSAISNAYLLIQRLLCDVLREDPVRELTAGCWQILLDEYEVHEAERARCAQTFSGVRWQSMCAHGAVELLCCPKCNSDLVKHNGPADALQSELELSCAACGADVDFGICLAEALGDVFGTASHIAVVDGEEPPLQQCPECDHQTYVMEDNRCANCLFSLPDTARCNVCDSRLSLEEYAEWGSVCSYHAWQLARND